MKIKNELNFNIKLCCGKKTKPEIIVSYLSVNSGISIGNEQFSQQEISEWIEKALLEGLRKANSPTPSDR